MSVTAPPSPYWVSNSSKPVPSKAERKPFSRATQEAVAALTLTMPIFTGGDALVGQSLQHGLTGGLTGGGVVGGEGGLRSS